jgi:hypothetical protein
MGNTVGSDETTAWVKGTMRAFFYHGRGRRWLPGEVLLGTATT